MAEEACGLWWERVRRLEKRGREWTETRAERGTRGELSEVEVSCYEPILDYVAVEAALRLSGVQPGRWPLVVELLEVAFWASRRRWSAGEVLRLEQAW